jgi:hypothetical protein
MPKPFLALVFLLAFAAGYLAFVAAVGGWRDEPNKS